MLAHRKEDVMKRSLPRLALVVVITAASAIAASHGHHQAGHAPHWSYDGEGGPEHWADLDASFKECKVGHLQSPIDIPAATIKLSQLDPIGFDYKPTPLRIVDNGHTVMVTYAPGSTIHIDGAEYEVQQVHFHHPAEEKIDGKPYPLVAHIVHKNKEGKLAVVAVLFRQGAA